MGRIEEIEVRLKADLPVQMYDVRPRVYSAQAREDIRALLALAKAATHATDGRTDVSLTARDLRGWASAQAGGALCHWILGIADAVDEFEKGGEGC